MTSTTFTNDAATVSHLMSEGMTASEISMRTGIHRSRVHWIAKKANLGSFARKTLQDVEPKNEVMSVRLALGWTQQQMADYLIMDRTGVSKMEKTGRVRGLVRQALERLIAEHKLKLKLPSS